MTEDEWNELRAKVEAWDTWRQKKNEEARRRNCKHERKTGTGLIGSDGSSHSTWNCPDCGAHGEMSTPPRADGDGMRAMLGSLPR